MGEVLNEAMALKRNSVFAMIVAVIVFFVASRASGQEQALSTVPPPHAALYPFMDLFSGPSVYPEPTRKSYSDSGYSGHHQVSSHNGDTLGSFASILGSAAKIMLASALIFFLKMMSAKLMLFPLKVMLMAKIGLKTMLLWPMISKILKYFKKKKKKGKSRAISDCSNRIACVIQRSSRYGWSGNLGAAATLALIDDIEEDSSFAKFLLSVLAGDKVAHCMSVECTSGVDIS